MRCLILFCIFISYNLVNGDYCSHIYGPLPITYPQDFGSKGNMYNLDAIWITGHFKDQNGYKYGLHIGFHCYSSTCKEDDIVCSYDISISDQAINKFTKDYSGEIKLNSTGSSFTDSLIQIGDLSIKRIDYDTFIFGCTVQKYSFLVKTKIVTDQPFIPLANNGFYKSDRNASNPEGDLFFTTVTQGNGVLVTSFANDSSIDQLQQYVTTEILFSRYMTSNMGWMSDNHRSGWHDRWILTYLDDHSLLHLFIPYYDNYTRSEYVAAGSYYTNGVSSYLNYSEFKYESSDLWISPTNHAYMINNVITIPKFNLSLITKPLIIDNEITDKAVEFNYYEAISNFHGFHNGHQVSGIGITEITQVI
jgi:hypothetical protein